MPILRFDDAPEFELSSVHVRGLAAPSRGATETLMYRIDVAPGQQLPNHTHDHEEVFYVLSGSLTAVLDGEEYPVAEGDTVMIPAGVEHWSFAGEVGAALLIAMPSGTVMIRSDGERVEPPWGR